MGGMVLVSSIFTTSATAGSTLIFKGSLYRLPGLRFQCWPSPWSMGSFTVWPSERWNVS